jgi:hypothetical protein
MSTTGAATRLKYALSSSTTLYKPKECAQNKIQADLQLIAASIVNMTALGLVQVVFDQIK